MLNRSNIEEANKHLQALYSRVSELESVVEEQHNALMAKDSFIQTKIKELSQQDLQIENLKQNLAERDRELTTKNDQIDTLQGELNAKNSQISTLNQKSKALTDLINLLPDLKSYITKVDTISLNVRKIDSGEGYVEVSESPSVSDDAENTDGDVIKSYDKVNGDVYENSTEGSASVAEMARNFAQLEGTKKFSVGEDDLEGGEMNVMKNNISTKELYF